MNAGAAYPSLKSTLTCTPQAVPIRSSKGPPFRRVADLGKSKFTEEPIIGFLKQDGALQRATRRTTSSGT